MRRPAPADGDKRRRDERPTRPSGGTPSPGSVDAVRRLQQTAGNQAVGRWLARDGFQLETPWLLGGRRPEDRYPRLMEGRLRLDPDLQRSILRPLLSADSLLQYLAEARPATGQLSMRNPPRRPDPMRPPPDPAEPPGFERPAERASAGTFLGAVRRVPEVRRALENVEYQVWGRLSSGDRTTLVTTGVTFGAATLGGMLATPGGRSMLGHLSGIPLTVPRAPWLAFEFSSQRDVIGLGVHVDVGALLGGRLGFGEAGPRSGSRPLYGGGRD